MIAVHFNDQEGGYGQGKDLHAPIGQGRLFSASPESLELFWYVFSNFDVVLEYDDSRVGHVDLMRRFRERDSFDSRALHCAAALSDRLALASSNEY